MNRDDDSALGDVDPELLARLIDADARIDAVQADPLAWEGKVLDLLDRGWIGAAGTAPEVPPPASIGRYRVVRELGRGGFGIVYLAHDPELGDREVALKVPLPSLAASPDVRRRFTREALAVAVLEHPNVVPVLDARTEGPDAYIISAYCPGPSLATWLRGRIEPVHPRTAARLAEALAQGIEHAHSRKILHRDLKPANVMLNPGGDIEAEGLIPRVTDFGLAKLADDSFTDETRTGLIIGSAPYMAPEQVAARRGEIGPATDVYALGATLYEILVGRPPFRGGSQFETYQQILTRDPVPPTLFRRDIPRDLQTICLHALRKHPAHRYPTAAAFGDDLGRFLRGEPILARPASAPERAWNWSRRHPTLATVLAAVVLLVGLANVGLGWANARLQREVERADSHAREADRQRALVAERAAITDRHLHAARLNLARQAIEAGQPERAQAVLSDASEATGSHRSDFTWRYLWQLSRRELAVWGRHDSLIRHLILSPDGSTLASADLSGQIHLRDVSTGRLVRTCHAATGSAEQVAFSPDGTLLAAAGFSDRADALPRITVYRVATGEALAQLDVPGVQKVDRLAFDATSQTLLALAVNVFGNWSVRGWALEALDSPALTIQPRFRLEDGGKVVLAADGESFWTVASGGRLLQYDGLTGALLRTIQTGAAGVGALACSRDGQLLAAVVAPARVLLWDLATAAPPRVITPAVIAQQVIPPDELIFTGDGGALLVITGGYQARLIHLSDGAVREILPLDPERVGRLGFAASPDGRWLATFGEYHPGGVQPVVLWDVASGRPVKTFAGRRRFEHVAFDTRGRSVFLGNDYDLAAWQPFPPEQERFERLDDHNDEVWSVNFSPDGATVVSSGDDDRIRFWNPRTGARGLVLAGHTATVSAVAWHPNGALIASGSLDQRNNLKLWDVRTGTVVADLPGHTERVRAVVFSPDGKVLASAGTDRIIRIWDGTTGQPVRELVGNTDLVRGLAFARDGRNLTSVGNDGTIRVWDWAAGRTLVTFPERYNPSAVVYSPDGTTLATADEEGFIRLRDTVTWKTRRVVQSDDREIMTLTYSPDGETLVSAGISRTIRFWDPMTGHPLMELKEGTSNQINDLAFSPDGTMLLVADHGGRVLIYHGPQH